MSFSHVLPWWSLLFSFKARLLALLICLFLLLYTCPNLSENWWLRRLHVSWLRRHVLFHGLASQKLSFLAPPQYCFSSCLLNKYSQLIDSSDRHERSPNAYQIISRGHHCSILDVDAAMGRICDWIFAVILVFFLTKGTSSNEGKASHWLLVCVVIFTRLRGVILAGRMIWR